MHRRTATTLLILACTATAARAQTAPVIQGPWARATPGQAPNGAAYLSVSVGSGTDRLLGAAAPVARRVELHTHLEDNGVMRMRAVPAIDIVAGRTVVLRPGGLHIMLMGLTEPLREGTSFRLTLRFEQAGEVTVDVPVLGAAAMAPPARTP